MVGMKLGMNICKLVLCIYVLCVSDVFYVSMYACMCVYLCKFVFMYVFICE